MFDAQKLLGAFLDAKAAPSASSRVERAVGPEGMGGQGGLLDQLTGLLGAGGAGGAGGLQGLLSQVSGAAQGAATRTGDAVKRNDPLAVGGLGAVAGALLGGRGGAVGGGALALLGSLAYAALNASQSSQQAASPTVGRPSGAAATPPELPVELRGATGAGDEAVLASRALILLRAMISAAKADGTIDQDEMNRIFKKLDETGADSDAKDYVIQELRAPIDLEGLVAQVQAPDLAVQVYAASLLAIEVDTDAERAYLARLAQSLALPPAAVAHIHQTLGVPQA